MKAQRIIAAGLAATAAATLATATGQWAYPGIIALMAMLAIPGRWQWRMRPARRMIVLLLIIMVFALRMRWAPQEYDTIRFVGDQRWVAVAQCFLALIVFCLFVSWQDILPTVLPLGALAAIACVGLAKPNIENGWQYRGLTLVTLALAVFYASTCRGQHRIDSTNRGGRQRHILAALALAAALLGGWIGGGLFDQHYQRLENLFAKLDPYLALASAGDRGVSGSLGFTESPQLGGIRHLKQTGANKPALRVFSSDQPGYLRAGAFDHFSDSRWKSSSRSLPVPHIDTDKHPGYRNLDLPGTANVFVLRDVTSGNWRVMDIWPVPELASTVFTRSATTVVQIPVESILVDENGIVTADDLIGGLNYATAMPSDTLASSPADIHVNTSAGPESDPCADASGTGPEASMMPLVSENLLQRCLQIDPDLDPKIHDLANGIFTESTTPSHKVEAVVRFFHNNFTYRLGTHGPSDQDPLTHFLLTGHQGHCEFFAAGAAVLLRLAGVPTRYVTGFVVTEQAAYGEYWLARNRDAHAWVEAWDGEQSRWVLVEATSPDGVPSTESRSFLGGILEHLGFRLQQLRAATHLNGLRGLASWLWRRLVGIALALLTTVPGLIITAMLLVAVACYARRKMARREKPVPMDPRVVAMHQLLGKMDQRLRRLGFVRARDETLHRFSGRISLHAADSMTLQHAASWYCDYASLRYCSKARPNDIDRLRATIAEKSSTSK